MIDFSKKYKVYFMGVGGVSMHSLALFCNSLGWTVFGSDIKDNNYTNLCKNSGITIFIGHKKSNIKDYDIIVKTGAINNDNIELVYAEELGLKIYDRAEFLGEISRQFECVIAIAGTHGKSTTSSMIYEMLKSAGYNVSCHIGADVNDARLSLKDSILVLEACEYNKTFLKLKVDIGVILNVECDHLESYGGMYQLKNGFKTFLKHAKKRYVFDTESTKYLTLKNIVRISKPIYDNNIFTYKTKKIKFNNISGQQYAIDAMVAVAVCDEMGVSCNTMMNVLKNFVPLPRRNQKIGKVGDAIVYIDYAHHPTEIKYLIDNFNLKNVLYIFQPHTFSRTKYLLKEFVQVFKDTELIIFKEYSAREKSSDGISANQLYENIKNINPKTNYAESCEEIISYINNSYFEKIIFVGAGNINEIAEKVLLSKSKIAP